MQGESWYEANGSLLSDAFGGGDMTRSLERLATWVLAMAVAMLLTFSFSSTADAACCTGRECTEDNLIVCFLKGGNWSPVPCIPFVTCAITGAQGACCTPFIGYCAKTTEGFCFGGAFYEGVECSDIPSCANPPPRGACCGLVNSCDVNIEAGCKGFGESFVEGASCGDDVCGLLGAKGACCVGGGCIDFTIGGGGLCAGNFRPGQTCAQVNQCRPPVITGACCTAGMCSVTTESTCDANNGVFAPGLDCSIADLCALPEPEGACCIDATTCVESKKADCLVGSFQEAASCSDAGVCDHLIPPKTGACCLGDRCEVLTHAACNTSGGAYEGDDAACAANTCALPPTEGACCTPDGGCVEGPENACAVGTWHKEGSCLQPGLCAAPPKVACCNGFTCDMMTEEGCRLGGGTPSGASCSAGLCGAPAGACCLNEVCTGADAASCGGTFIAAESCPAFDCTGRGIIGGCCLPNGRCDDATRGQCNFAGGTWNAGLCDAVGATCDDNLPEGACCEADSCSVGTSASCGGTFHEGLTCSAAGCTVPDAGSCCSGGSCTIVNAATCAADGGAFTVGGDCDDLAAECPGAVRGACCADGSCTNASRHSCIAGGGSFHEDGKCEEDTALCAVEVKGNCCAQNHCSVITEDECVGLAGTFLGTGLCDANVCGAVELQGACCTADGCEQLTEAACTAAKGSWQASVACALSECADVSPPVTEGDGVVFTGGRLGSCASMSAGSSGAWALLGLVAIGYASRRRRAKGVTAAPRS